MRKKICIFMSLSLMLLVTACGKQTSVDSRIEANESETESQTETNKMKIELSEVKLALVQEKMEYILEHDALKQEKKKVLTSQNEDEKITIQQQLDELQNDIRQFDMNIDTK